MTTERDTPLPGGESAAGYLLGMKQQHEYTGLAMCPQCHDMTFYVGKSLILCANLRCDFSCERRLVQVLNTCECLEGRHLRPHWQNAFPYNPPSLDE